MGLFSRRRAERATPAEPEQLKPVRVWLDVPYADKDAAKALGARFDGAARRWYAPPGRAEVLSRWAALPEIPDLLPGEDRCFGAGLFVDLVPASCWFTNARSCVSGRDWERLRRMVIARAGQRCEICGHAENRSLGLRLEVHERWAYDETTGVQSLRRLLCVCSPCHEVTHYGLAEIRGEAAEALTWLWAVTDMTEQQVITHVEDAFQLWRRRCARRWALDLSMLTTAGITLARPPDRNERVGVAERTLRRYR